MQNQNSEQNKIVTFSLLIIAIISMSFALYYTRTVVVPLVLALFLRMLISPIIDYQIHKLKIHRYVAIPVAILIVVCFFILIIPPVFNSLIDFLENADDYQDKIIILVDFILRLVQEKFGINTNIEAIENTLLNLPFLKWTSDLLGHTADFFESLFIVLIILLFLIIGESTKEKTHTWYTIDQSVKKYITAKFFIALITAIIFGTTYIVLKLELAIIFATLTFFLTFIPIFGAVIAILLPIPVAFIQFTSEPWTIFLIILIPTITKIIIGDFVEPKVIGSALNLHPVTIVLALIFWGILWGIIGVFLAAPITAIIRFLFEQFDTTKPLARLLTGNIHYKNH